MYTKCQQRLREAVAETSLKPCQGEYCERQAAMEMGVTQLLLVLSSYIQESICCYVTELSAIHV